MLFFNRKQKKPEPMPKAIRVNDDAQLGAMIGISTEEMKDAYPSTIDLLKTLLKYGSKFNLVQNSSAIRIIPEIACQCAAVCLDIEEALVMSKMLMDQEPEVIHNTRPMWCTLAGMGAVYLCKQDWSNLKKRGIFDSLVKNARGINYMDEYVYALMNVKENTQEHMTFYFTFTQVADFITGGIQESYTEDYLHNVYFRAERAMFLYGMIIAMNRLQYP